MTVLLTDSKTYHFFQEIGTQYPDLEPDLMTKVKAEEAIDTQFARPENDPGNLRVFIGYANADNKCFHKMTGLNVPMSTVKFNIDKLVSDYVSSQTDGEVTSDHVFVDGIEYLPKAIHTILLAMAQEALEVRPGSHASHFICFIVSCIYGPVKDVWMHLEEVKDDDGQIATHLKYLWVVKR